MRSTTGGRFDVRAFFDSTHAAYRATAYGEGAIVFEQGQASEHVFYIQQGRVELSVLSITGEQVVVAILGPSHFFGERALAGQSVRCGRATAITPCTILAVGTTQMRTLLQSQHRLSARFVAHLLARQARSEAGLLDQLFNAADKRLARALWLLAESGASRTVPRTTQQTLGEMVGTGRSRINVLLKKFKRLGLLDVVGEHITVNDSLRTFAGEDARPLARSSRVERPEPETILLVDDEASVRAVVTRMLEHNGYHVVAAGDSGEAYTLFDHHPPINLLLADVVMPDMSGTALAQRLVTMQPMLPVLLMSGYMSTATFPAAEAHRTGFLAKPFRTPALTSAVRRLLRSPAGAA